MGFPLNYAHLIMRTVRVCQVLENNDTGSICTCIHRKCMPCEALHVVDGASL
jgi:hypothetical protein